MNAQELDEIQKQRERKVYKSDLLINARYTLSVLEQRLVLYAISQCVLRYHLINFCSDSVSIR